MWLKRNVVQAVENEHVQVFYLNWEAACLWNERKNDPDVPWVFCGWYWAKGLQEAGPFMAAILIKLETERDGLGQRHEAQ